LLPLHVTLFGIVPQDTNVSMILEPIFRLFTPAILNFIAVAHSTKFVYHLDNASIVAFNAPKKEENRKRRKKAKTSRERKLKECNGK
jgi:hypothetical protein